MKIRIKGNSLRYRLTRPEVEQFKLNGFIQEQINFGGNALSYALCTTEKGQLSALFNHNQITVYVPSGKIEEWTNTDQVGIEEEKEINGFGETLHLLVEKDFTCLDKVDEDQTDNYPNPLNREPYE